MTVVSAKLLIDTVPAAEAAGEAAGELKKEKNRGGPLTAIAPGALEALARRLDELLEGTDGKDKTSWCGWKKGSITYRPDRLLRAWVRW